MHFALMCPPYTGHLNPMFAVAQALRSRGHRSTFVGLPDTAERVVSAGFEQCTLGAVSHPCGSLRQMEGRLARLEGFIGLRTAISDMAGMTNMLCREGAAALRKLAPDGIVCDQLEAAGGLLARHLRMPCISVANALMIDREPYVPPPFTAWRYARTGWGRSRNLGGYRVTDWLMSDVSQVIARWSKTWQLPGCRTVEDCLAPVQIGQLSPALDFPREALPTGFHYTGPLRPSLGTEEVWHAPSYPLRRFVYVSLGSLQGGRFELIASITQACRDQGFTAVVAHGGRLDAAQSAALPGAPIVEPFVAQRRVIEHCDLVITHGGMNTVLDALTVGVPLVLVPLAMEQGAISQRCVRAGVGLQVRSRLPGVRALRTVIGASLGGARCTHRAASLAAALKAAGGATRAAELIECHAS